MAIKTVIRKSHPTLVCEVEVGSLDVEKCSPKFLSHNLPKDTIVNVKCFADGTFDLRGKKQQYRIVLPD